MKIVIALVAGYYLLGRLGYRVRIERAPATYTEEPLLGVVHPPETVRGITKADVQAAARELRSRIAADQREAGSTR